MSPHHEADQGLAHLVLGPDPREQRYQHPGRQVSTLWQHVEWAVDEISVATMISEAARFVVHYKGANPGAAAFVVTTGASACNRSRDNGICI
jgi:hypothetical protein